ncbi:MAG TPA: hypothetical protein VE262_09745 [Blastocatellia bacterium]|nr:hypothetical protein [Blastocatellia bacterium]
MPGQEILRFVQLVAPKKKSKILKLNLQLTSFGEGVVNARGQEGGSKRVFELADDFLGSERFELDATKIELAPKAFDFVAALREKSAQPLSGYEELIEYVFGEAPADLVEGSPFKGLRNKVFDGLIALKMLPEKHPRLLAEYADLQRAISIIERAAEKDERLAELNPQALLAATISLPEEIFPLPSAAAERGDPAPADDRQGEIASLTQEIADLERTTDEILSLGARDLEVVGPSSETKIGFVTEAPASSVSFSLPAERASLFAAPTQDIARDSSVVFKRSSVEGLTENTRTLLSSLGIDPENSSLSTVLDKLESRSFKLQKELNLIDAPPAPPQFFKLGTTTIPDNFPAFPGPGGLAQPEAPGVPTSVGQIRPSHVGRLLRTLQNIVRYEAEEIAHVENVVIGESKNRETRRLRRTEESFTREEETTREEERDLQTTERMELQREVQNTVKDSQQFKIGASISAGYGPVEVSVSTEFSTESSSESIDRTASSYAREITEKTASRITERIREERTTRTIEEFEETNQHGFANNTDEHISAIFQWLVKVYRAQVYDYGVRLFFNITVPEPQYFLLNTLAKQKAPVEGLKQPDPIDFKPGDIKTSTYQKYVRKYQVEGVRPPPKQKKIISKVFRYPETAAPQNEPPPEEMTDSLEVPIEDGYKAVEAYVICLRGRAKHGAGPHPNDVLTGLSVFIGEATLSFISDQAHVIKGNYHTSLADEVGSIMIGLHARNIMSYVLGIEITIVRTERALAQWQHETYDAILARYQTLEAEYRERKAELETQEGIKIEGRNPLENRLLERNELKRSAITMLTGQYFEEFDAILGFSEGRIDFDEAVPEGRYARFFENAFEWENMVYQFYPYFWGRKSTWQKKLLLQDVDATHAEFLKCGYADMEIPVRPGFEAALMHYLDTGKVWQGAEPPDITTSKYVAFLEEIKERREQEEPHQEFPVGEPWEIRLPTTLVRIRPGNSLPEWQQDEETGEWVPVAEEE